MSRRSNARDRSPPPHSHNADRTAASDSNGNISDNEEPSSALTLETGDDGGDDWHLVDEDETTGDENSSLGSLLDTLQSSLSFPHSRFILTSHYFLFSENEYSCFRQSKHSESEMSPG